MGIVASAASDAVGCDARSMDLSYPGNEPGNMISMYDHRNVIGARNLCRFSARCRLIVSYLRFRLMRILSLFEFEVPSLCS